MARTTLSALALSFSMTLGFAPLGAQESAPDAFPALSSDTLQQMQQAAETGNVAKQFELATRYLNGDGVPVDNFEALRWFKLAADQGSANAQYNIAVMYLNGIGVIRDPAEAVQWFVAAAENGDTAAQFTLAVLLFNGQLDVPQNLPHAYKWFLLAGAAGHQTAAANAVLIQELLPAETAAAMQADALEWIDDFQQRNNRESTPNVDQVP